MILAVRGRMFGKIEGHLLKNHPGTSDFEDKWSPALPRDNYLGESRFHPTLLLLMLQKSTEFSPPGMVLKPVVNNGIYTQYQLVNSPDFWLPSTVPPKNNTQKKNKSPNPFITKTQQTVRAQSVIPTKDWRLEANCPVKRSIFPASHVCCTGQKISCINSQNPLTINRHSLHFLLFDWKNKL